MATHEKNVFSKKALGPSGGEGEPKADLETRKENIVSDPANTGSGGDKPIVPTIHPEIISTPKVKGGGGGTEMVGRRGVVFILRACLNNP